MKDRHALVEALGWWEDLGGEWTDILKQAAKERLAQLPETCETCGGAGVLCRYDPPTVYTHDHDDGCICPPCNGSGKVYPVGTVDRIAGAIALAPNVGGYHSQAVAVLEALGETP